MSTFLLVDDSKFMKNILRNIITSAGHSVIGEASNGCQALEEYKKLRPDLITMDITMDEVDGIEGLKLIREYDPSAAVIMCSSMGQQCLIIEAIQSGAKEFIVKPFTPEKVMGIISHVITKIHKQSAADFPPGIPPF